MDVLDALLTGPRARQAFLLRASLAPPWSLDIRDGSPLTLLAVVAGTAHLQADGASTALDTGDVLLRRGPEPYRVADAPSTPTLAVIHPGQRCETPAGSPLAEVMALGVRTWGNDPDGPTQLLIGTYEHEAAVGRRLLDALPPVVVQRAADVRDDLVPLLAEEVARADPGQTAVLDRLLDVLLVRTLRRALAAPSADAPWFGALEDPVVGHALRLLHHDPARGWTVAGLAREVGVSRAALARRFTDLVGEPPMAYLTRWRLDLAADLLADPSLTLEAIAARVGYGTPFALSAAFSRVRGRSPSAHRRELVAAAG